MARPPISEDDKRSVWIKYRASPKEAAAIHSRCKATGLSLSAYNRTLALEGLIVQREPLADHALIRALAAIGNNLNQLARQANIHGEIDSDLEERLEAPLVRLEEVIEELTS